MPGSTGNTSKQISVQQTEYCQTESKHSLSTYTLKRNVSLQREKNPCCAWGSISVLPSLYPGTIPDSLLLQGLCVVSGEVDKRRVVPHFYFILFMVASSSLCDLLRERLQESLDSSRTPFHPSLLPKTEFPSCDSTLPGE